MRFVVLGAGLVGGPMALDLAADEGHEVTVADISGAALARLVARLMASGGYSEPGIRPPEFIGRDAGRVQFVLDGLAARGVTYHHAVETT